MKTYILINNYMSGPSVWDQIQEIIDAGKMNEDTRLFFPKNQHVTMGEIAKILGSFKAVTDMDFDRGNVVFAPEEWFLTSIRAEKEQRK